MINDDIAARIAAKAARDIARIAAKAWGEGWTAGDHDADLDEAEHTINPYRAQAGGHSTPPTLPWLQPATVDPDWLTEARNHSAATREPFTHPLWDEGAA